MKNQVIKYYQNQEAGEGYHAKRYEGFVGSLRSQLILQNIERIAKPSSFNKSKVLEVAPGTGVLASSLLKKYPSLHYYAADTSSLMISYLQKHVKKIKKVVQSDGRELPFPDNTFDIVIALRLFIHYKNPQEFLAEFERVLKPGGIIIVDAHNFFRLDLYNTVIRRFINPKGLFGSKKVESYYLFPWEIFRKYGANSLKIKKIIGHKFIPLHPFVRRLLSSDRYFRLEDKLSESVFKYFAFDTYIKLEKHR